jgi:hypothetical protein
MSSPAKEGFILCHGQWIFDHGCAHDFPFFATKISLSKMA